MVSLNRVASVYMLLIIDPQCISAINDEIMHTVVSEDMRQMLMVPVAFFPCSNRRGRRFSVTKIRLYGLPLLFQAAWQISVTQTSRSQLMPAMVQTHGCVVQAFVVTSPVLVLPGVLREVRPEVQPMGPQDRLLGRPVHHIVDPPLLAHRLDNDDD